MRRTERITLQMQRHTAWLAGSELLFLFFQLLKQLAGKTAAATSFYQELLLSCFHTQLAVI